MKNFKLDDEDCQDLIDRIRIELKKFDNGLKGHNNNIELFIEKFYALLEKIVKLSLAQEIADHREKLKDIKKRMKAVIKDLKQISALNKQLIPNKKLDDLSLVGVVKTFEFQPKAKSTFEKSYDLLEKSLEQIEAAERELELSKPKRGRPRADALGIAKELANIYYDYIGRPTKYSDGPFANILRYVFEFIGLKHEDPTRSVSRAINQFPPHLTDKNPRKLIVIVS